MYFGLCVTLYKRKRYVDMHMNIVQIGVKYK